MKNKNLLFAIGMIFLFLSMANVLAEIQLWNTVNVDNTTSIVNYHAFYQYDDTSSTGIGSSKSSDITLSYDIQALPYNLTPTYFGEVDWCNFTVTHIKHIYGTNFVAFQGFMVGDLLNTTIEVQSYYFTNMSFTNGEIVIPLMNKDNLIADMKCHYTDSRSLYAENVLVGRFTTYMSSYECAKCTDYSLEELSDMSKMNENITSNELGVYTVLQKIVDFNFQIWLIISWIVKIGMVLVAIGLIFAGVYYFYVFFTNLGRGLK